MTRQNINKLKKIIVPILKRNQVIRAGIFGSFARGEETKKSDLDLLIRVKKRKFSLLDLVGLELELEEKLNRKVDLLTYGSLHPLLKDRILKEEIKIL